jgi:uncharacterized protein
MKRWRNPKTFALHAAALIVSLIGLAECLLAQVYTPETVPNQKVATNQWVSNPDGIIKASTEALLNAQLDSLEKQTSAQVAVVLLRSIGEADAVAFAQALFDKWGIGQARNDNGLLILFVQDAKVIRFHTGFGLEGILPDVVCKRIQMQKMVPHFKAGDIDAGLLAGAQEVVKIISLPEYAKEVNQTEAASAEWGADHWLGLGILLALGWFIIFLVVFFVKGKSWFTEVAAGTNVPHPKLGKGQWLLLYVLVPPVVWVVGSANNSGWILLGSIYGYAALLALTKYALLKKETQHFIQREAFSPLYNYYQQHQGLWLALAIVMPLPFAFLFAAYVRQKKSLRTLPRSCKTCGQPMVLLNDIEEDEFLQKSMLLEEELKSVDYDVWQCRQCQHLAIEVYLNSKSVYEPCPRCRTIAYHEVSRRTTRHATTSHSGEREIVCACKFCGHRSTRIETIPRVVVTSSSSSGGGSRSGGSFGGGRSGGGGASSSW